MNFLLNVLSAFSLLIVVLFWIIAVPYLYARKLHKKDKHHFGMDINQIKEK